MTAQVAGNNIVLYSISEANGLSDDHVQCVLKDKSGLLWVGTSDGLNLLDGSSITIFRHQKNDSASLISSNILCLTEDVRGNIWIGTPVGLSCFLKKENKFISYLPNASPYGSSSHINSICITSKQNIWCSTDGGLFLFDPASHSFRAYYNPETKKAENANCNKLIHLIKDKDENKFWIASGNGLWSFDLNSFHYRKEISAANDPDYNELFTYVYESSDKKIWVGNWDNGLEQLDKQSGKVIHYSTLPLHPTTVSSITEATQPNGQTVLWLNGQLLAFDPTNAQFFQNTLPGSLSAIPDFSPCYRSTDGWVWLGSSAGLYVYNPGRQFFQHHFFNNEITSQAVVLSDWNQLTFVGGESENFLKLYDDNWKLKKDFAPIFHLETIDKKSGTHPAILSLIFDANKNLWLGTTAGIAKYNMETGHLQWFFHENNDNTSLPRNFITHLFFDSNKRLWVFPWREGIWMLDTTSGKFKDVWDHFLMKAGKPKKLVIADAVEDKNGNIWMSDLDEGIILYEKNSGKFSKPFSKQIGETVHTGNIYYKNGFLYSVIPDALLKWNENNRQLKIITIPPEMNKQLYNVCPDKIGNWWFITKNGLLVYNETSNVFRRFTTADGLLNNDMDGTLFCRSNGTMLFANNNYITSFNPQKFLTAVSKVPNEQLRKILVNEKPVTWDSISTLQFSYRSHNITFRWALPDFSNPLRNEYYCKLKGIDTGWRYIGNKGEIQYANLSPGNYTVELKASSANGVASSNIISVPFRVMEPFWKATWFILLAGLVLVSLFGIIVSYISQKNLKEKLLKLEKEQAVEKERRRISRDMHDDLGSGLTKIAIMSEVVKKQINDPEKAKQQLENISESSRELVDNLQDIIWILNPKNDTLESLASYIREYALKFFEPFMVETQFIFPEKFPLIRLSEETRRNIFLTVKESFNNIGKHAWCDKVTLAIGITDNRIELTIKDDGKGFDVNQTREFGNGLSNMKNRIQQIGGTYEIKSEPGKGTETKIKVSV